MSDAPGSIRPFDIILRAHTEKAEQDITKSAELMGDSIGKQAARMQGDLQKTEEQFKKTADAAKQAATQTAQAAAPRSAPLTSAPIITPAAPVPSPSRVAPQSGNYQPLTSAQLLAPNPPGHPDDPIRFNPKQDTGFQNKAGGGLVWDDKAKKWIDPTKPNAPVSPAIPTSAATTTGPRHRLPFNDWAKQQGHPTADGPTSTDALDVVSSADATSPDADTAANDAAARQSRSGRFRLYGAGLTLLGGVGRIRTNNLLADTQETRAAGNRMEAMLTRQGDAGSIDSMQALSGGLAQKSAMSSTTAIKDAISELSGFGMEAKKIEEVLPGLIGYSRIYGKELSTISDAAAEAFKSGDISGLENLGVKITDAQREAVEVAETQAEKQAAVYDILKSSFSSYSNSLMAGMTKTEINANRAALAMNELHSNMATGAEKVDSFAQGIKVSLMEMMMPSKGLQEAAGAAQSLGSYALTTGGSIMTLVGDISDAKDGLDNLGISTKGLMGSLGGLKGALAAADVALSGALIPTLTIALPAAIAYAAGKMIESWQNKISEVEDDYAKGKDNPVDEDAVKKSLELGGSKTREGLLAQADEVKSRREKAEEVANSNIHWAVRWGYTDKYGIGSGRAYNVEAEKIRGAKFEAQALKMEEDRLRRNAAKAPSAGQAQLTNVGIPTPAGGTATGTSYADPTAASSISLQPQIRALEDRIRATKSKKEREELKEQLINLRRAEQDRKAAESSARKAQRSLDRAADYASAVASAKAESEGGLAMMRLDAKDKIAANRARIALDSQIKNINNQKELGLIDDDQADNQIERLKHAYEVRNAAMEKDAVMRRAQIEAQAELAAAQAEASTQEAAQAQATLAKAKIKSNAILEKAKIEASVIGSDIAPLENKQSKRELLLSHLRSGGSLADIGKKGQMLLGGGLVTPKLAMGGGNSGALFNPYAGANYGNSDAFARMIGGGNVFNQAYQTPAGAWAKRRGKNVSHTAKINGNDFDYVEQPDGSFLLKLVTEIPLPPDKFMEALGMIG